MLYDLNVKSNGDSQKIIYLNYCYILITQGKMVLLLTDLLSSCDFP